MENKMKADDIQGDQSAHVGSGAPDPKLEADKRPQMAKKRAPRGTHSMATQGQLVEHEGKHPLESSHAAHGVASRDTHQQAKPKLAFMKVSSFEGFIGNKISLVESAAIACEVKCELAGVHAEGLFIYHNASIRFIPFGKIETITLKGENL